MPWQNRAKTGREESISTAWGQLRQYEDEENDSTVERVTKAETEAATSKNKMKQLRESSSRTFFNLKNQVSGLYRKSLARNSASAKPQNSDVSNSPHGEDPPEQNSCGPLQSIGMLGARIKSSTSLHNLEMSTKDTMRQVVEKTNNMGENMKHKYGSRVNMNSTKYNKFKDDPDSEEENSDQINRFQ